MDRHAGEGSFPLVRSELARQLEHKVSHPLNPQSEIHRISLGDLAGLRRLGVHLVRLPPAKESGAYHTHSCEEEFIYILSGRGRVIIDGTEHEVAPGDFMGFPTPSVAHVLGNPFSEELVYLVAGERCETEISDLPRLTKRVLRGPDGMKVVDHAAIEPLISDGI